MQWRRIDLHLHTMASKDYQEPKLTYLDILKKAEQEGLDIIAFTDHNTIAGYAAMQQEIADLERWQASGRLRPEEQDRLSEYHRLLDKILVLPGLELTATFGFHVLGIFDKDTPIRSLEHVLLQLNVPFDTLDIGETEVGATSDVITAYRVLDEAGALVVAAHANSSHGVAMFKLDFGGQTRIAYTQDPHLHAMEVTDLESDKRRTTASFFNGSRPQYPRRMHCIQGSDAHRIAGNRNNLGVGERATEVLIPDVSLDALRELFEGNDFSRVRPYTKAETPFDHVAAAREQGSTLVQSFHESMSRRGGRMHAVLRDVVAFANTNGGTIYVGTSPNTKVATKGVEDPETALKELRTEIGRLIVPPLQVESGLLQSEGKPIVRVNVNKGVDIPYVLEGSKIYLRQEGETVLAMRDQIVSLILKESKPVSTNSPAEPKRMSPAKDPVAIASPVRAEPRPRQQQPPKSAPSKAVSPQPEPAPVEVSESDRGLVSSVVETPSVGGLLPPKTGVEIVETVKRDGVLYHTMSDLRDNGQVHNVTRASARRLWRYAIALKEKNTFQADKVKWTGDLGQWHKYLRAGRPHYDLVQRAANGDVRVYYGVTEDGIHGPWRAVVGMED